MRPETFDSRSRRIRVRVVVPSAGGLTRGVVVRKEWAISVAVGLVK